MYSERKGETRNSGRESKSQSSDGVSESTNKRQEKTLKVIFKKESLQAHLHDHLPLPHLRQYLVEID